MPGSEIEKVDRPIIGQMQIGDWSIPAALWLGCRVVLQGDMRSCLAAWLKVTASERAESYIQPSTVLHGKRRYRAQDIADLAHQEAKALSL
jgi:hypothetical protein